MRLSLSTSPPMASSMVTAWGSRPQKPCLRAFWLPGEAPTGRAPPPWAARRGGLQPRTAQARQGDPLWVVAPQRDFDGLSPLTGGESGMVLGLLAVSDQLSAVSYQASAVSY